MNSDSQQDGEKILATLKRGYPILPYHLHTGNSMTDTALICEDGSLFTCAFLLGQVSPFMKDLLTDAMDGHTGEVNIFLPEYTLASLDKVFQLVQSGSTTAGNDAEAKILIDIMKKLFQIDAKKITNRHYYLDRHSGTFKELVQVDSDDDSDEVTIIEDQNMTSVGNGVSTVNVVAEDNSDTESVVLISD